ncbi:MAG TPA: DUF4440 domain-containing protein [Vicinamibacterales bacterium]|nr:DUF4440 domain-containing protein [Vicinamibacterales bacterium]
MSTDVGGINATLREYVAAVNAGDAEAYGITLTDDVVFMPPDSPKLIGREAVVTWVTRDFFGPFTIQFRATFDDVHVWGSQALASGAFSLDLTPKAGGTPLRTTGKFMNVFRKQADGSWKYAQAIFNFDKPLA